jgi:GTP-binding protein
VPFITIKHLRNIAIIAHVDHGKTTLVDALLRQTNVFRDNQEVAACVMDSNDLERERGITIFSKNAAIDYHGTRINVIDTPGHADFGGEVERVLKMSDGALLLVDAFEGPMPQTRFVLKKALASGLKILVVINKIDRADARPHHVLDEVFDLFVHLNATPEQLDFPVIYASGRAGFAKNELEDESTDCQPLLDAIVKNIPAPEVDVEAPLQLQVASIDYNDYVGRLAIGRVVRGKVREKQELLLLKKDGRKITCRAEKLEIFSGIGRRAVSEVAAGDIAIVHGAPEVDIYDTLTAPDCPEALPVVAIDEPTLTMEFRANDSPFSGQEGKFVTSRHLAARLEKELLSNVALKVEQQNERFLVSGRGLMHLGILVENMRREGYELAVGKPHVIYRETGGKKQEPVEILTVDVPDDAGGKVMEIVGTRRGNLEKMEPRNGRQHLEFIIPSRGLIGLRSRLLNATRGEAVINHVLLGYEDFRGEVPRRANGVMVSSDQGPATPYAIDGLQQRGVFFIPPATQVYAGMVVGEHNRDNDLAVNVCRAKKMTNVRAAGSDKNMEIAPHKQFSLEAALEYIEDDELLEVTPQNLRMRKRLLNESDRRRAERRGE